MSVNASDLEKLVERCKSGNNRAQHALYGRYADAMYNVSLRIVGHSGDAEDVLQLAFIQAFNNLKDLKSNRMFSSWLKRIVVNRSIDFLRKKNRLDIISLDDENYSIHLPQGLLTHPGDGFYEDQDPPEEQLIQEIKAGIDRLADGYRTVLSLYLLEGYDHREIATVLGISEATSRTQYMRARNKLRDMVRENLKKEI